MQRLLPIFIWTVCGLAIVPPLVMMPPLSAQQYVTPSSRVNAMIALDPSDVLYAGKPTMAKFMMTRSNGDAIAPSECNCQVKVYTGYKEAIAHDLPTPTIRATDHQAKDQAILAAITFPKPGAYIFVLSGQARDQSFDAFQLKFSVTVQP